MRLVLLSWDMESLWLSVSTLCVLATHVGHSICHGHRSACVLVDAFLINISASQLYNGRRRDTSSHTLWLSHWGHDFSSFVSLFLRVLFFFSRGASCTPSIYIYCIYIYILFFSLNLEGKVAIYLSGSCLFHLTWWCLVPSIFLEMKQFSSYVWSQNSRIEMQTRHQGTRCERINKPSILWPHTGSKEPTEDMGLQCPLPWLLEWYHSDELGVLYQQR